MNEKCNGKNSNRDRKRANSSNRRTRSNSYDRKNDQISDRNSTLHNSPSWYEVFPGSTELVARQSFGTPLGTPFKFRDFKSYGASDSDNTGFAAFPGLMVIKYLSVPGISNPGDYASAVNTAAHAYYTSVRYSQRGSGTYDDSDLMIGTQAIFSLYELWSYMRRAYGVLNMYSASNKYLSKTLFEAHGLDFEDFQNHIYDFEGFINNFALKISEFCVPMDFDIIDRRVRMSSNIYVDSDSPKAQMYMFMPACFWLFDELGTEGYTVLKPKEVPSKCKFKDLVVFANSIYYGLRSSQSLMNMTGDVKNAYGTEGIKKITTVDASYMAPILYDPEMCMEIQNLTCLNRDFSDLNVVLRANNSTNLIECGITYDTHTADKLYPECTQVLFNIRGEQPTAEQVMRATRLTTFTLHVNLETMMVTTCGTEVPLGIVVYKWFSGGNDLVIQTRVINTVPFLDTDVETLLSCVEAEKFDFHPYIYVARPDSDEPTEATNLIAIGGDVDDAILLNSDVVEKMNMYAVLGLMKTKRMDIFITK